MIDAIIHYVVIYFINSYLLFLDQRTMTTTEQLNRVRNIQILFFFILEILLLIKG